MAELTDSEKKAQQETMELQAKWLETLSVKMDTLVAETKSQSSMDTVKAFKQALKEGGASTEDEEALQNKLGLMQLGYSEDDADLRISANKMLKANQEEQKRLTDLQEEFGGLTARDSTILKQLQYDEENMINMRKFGRNLSSMEKGLMFFSKDWVEKLLEQNRDKESALNKPWQGLGADLRGDFDKVTAFLGPAAGALQNLPFLGTIAKFAGNLIKKQIANFIIWRRERKLDRKHQKKVEKQNADSNKMQNKELEDNLRRDAKAFIAPQSSLTGGLNEPDVDKGEKGEGDGGLFEAAAGAAALGATAPIFNPATMTAFVTASALAAAGLLLLGAGVAGFIALVGLGAGAAIGALMKGFANGIASFEETGANDSLERMEKIDMVKVAAGLAALAGASVLNSIAGLIDLLPGDSNVYTKLGEDAAGFANAINGSGFMDIDTEKFNNSVDMLFGASMQSSFAGFLSWFKGDATPFTDMGQDVAGFASAVKPFMDMETDTFVDNITKIKEAMADFELPENKDGLLKSLFGESGVDQLASLAKIKFVDPHLGSNMVALGAGVNSISAGLEDLDSSKLKSFVKQIDDFENITLNFGASPTTAGATFDVKGGGKAENVNNVVTQIVPTSNQMRVQKNFAATGTAHRNSRANHHIHSTLH